VPLLLGSANLIHSGLRPNGPSNMASRHRLKTTAAVAPCTSRKSQVAPTVQPEEKESACARTFGLIQAAPGTEKRASLERFLSRCSSKRAVGDQSALPRRENERAWKDHSRCSPSPPGKRARLGAPRVGRVRMAIGVTTRCTPRKSQPKSYPPLGSENQASLEGSF